MRDNFGRSFKTLRVSLINTCSLGCVYCTCGTEEVKSNFQLTKEKGLPTAELAGIIAKLHNALNLETVRFTGGEPLLYAELPAIVKAVKTLGIEDLKITTNGVLLENMAEDLAAAGISYINVSLDAVDEAVFFNISRRRGITKILRGIDKAIACGLDVKLNAVIMRGINESQILPLLEFAFERVIKIRFLEIMQMGHLFGQSDLHFVSQAEILDSIREKYQFNKLSRKSSSTANYWQTTEGHIFGSVANESEPFCSDCNRLRLDSMGNIYGCLSSNHPVSLENTDTEKELLERLQLAMSQKQSLKFTGSSLSMLNIGG